MFLSWFEKNAFLGSKNSFLQKSIHGELGTNFPADLTVFMDVSILPNKSQHKHFKSPTTLCDIR